MAAWLYKTTMLEAARNYSHWSDKIKMWRNTTTCRIKNFIQIENINVEKPRFTKIYTNKFSQLCLYDFK